MVLFLYQSPCDSLKDRYLTALLAFGPKGGMKQPQYNSTRAGQGRGKRPDWGGSLVFFPAGLKPHGPVVSLRADLHVSVLHLELVSPRSPFL